MSTLITPRPDAAGLTTPPPPVSVPAELVEGAELAPGYRIVELLSRGQALDVYEVYSERHWCHCIAKTLRPDRTEERVRERLLSEGEIALSVSHPHLVRGVELIRGPRPVVVVETVLGDTLEEIMADRRRRLPAVAISHLGLQLAAALHALHSSDYVHLDVRPANVVSRAGAAVLIDLSIARRPGQVRAGYGTPGSMSPEQANGEWVGTPADVWGLGITLYQAATGVVRDRLSVTADPLMPVGQRRRLPAGLARIIDDCLIPDPARRPDLAEVYARLGECVSALSD